MQAQGKRGAQAAGLSTHLQSDAPAPQSRRRRRATDAADAWSGLLAASAKEAGGAHRDAPGVGLGGPPAPQPAPREHEAEQRAAQAQAQHSK